MTPPRPTGFEPVGRAIENPKQDAQLPAIAFDAAPLARSFVALGACWHTPQRARLEPAPCLMKGRDDALANLERAPGAAHRMR